MSNPTWPVGLNHRKPLVRDLTEQPPHEIVRTEVSAGDPKQRPLQTDGPRLFSVALLLLQAELVIFDEWRRDVLGMGAIPFDWINPRTGDAAECLMLDRPSYRPTGPRNVNTYWSVAFSMEILPQPGAVPPPPPPAGGVLMPGNLIVDAPEVEEPGGEFEVPWLIIEDPGVIEPDILVAHLANIVVGDEDVEDGDSGGLGSGALQGPDTTVATGTIIASASIPASSVDQ